MRKAGGGVRGTVYVDAGCERAVSYELLATRLHSALLCCSAPCPAMRMVSIQAWPANIVLAERFSMPRGK